MKEINSILIKNKIYGTTHRVLHCVDGGWVALIQTKALIDDGEIEFIVCVGFYENIKINEYFDNGKEALKYFSDVCDEFNKKY